MTADARKDDGWRAKLEGRAQIGAVIAGPPDGAPRPEVTLSGDLVRAAHADLVLPALARLISAGTIRIDGARRDMILAANVLNAARNTKVLELLERVGVALNRVGIRPMVLKGVSHLLTGLWPTTGCRVVRDIDLLVPESLLPLAHEAVAALVKRGQTEMGDPDLISLKKHSQPIRDEDWPVSVELHHSIVQRQCGEVAPAECLLQKATPLCVNEAEFLIPSPEDQLLIAMVHGPLGTRMLAAPDVHLRDLLDITFLLRRDGDAIDIDGLQNRLDDSGWGVVGPLTNRCLRRFLDVSGPFRAPRPREALTLARWNWQLERPWAIRAGAVLWLTRYTARSILHGGGARRDTLGFLSRPRYIFRRYFLGRST